MPKAKYRTVRTGKQPRKNLVLTPEVASSMFASLMNVAGPVLDRLSRVIDSVNVLAKTNAQLVDTNRELVNALARLHSR